MLSRKPEAVVSRFCLALGLHQVSLALSWFRVEGCRSSGTMLRECYAIGSHSILYLRWLRESCVPTSQNSGCPPPGLGQHHSRNFGSRSLMRPQVAVSLACAWTAPATYLLGCSLRKELQRVRGSETQPVASHAFLISRQENHCLECCHQVP